MVEFCYLALFEASYLPRGNVPWRLEVVARMQSGHDVLLGWLDTSLAAMEEAGRSASKDSPAGPVTLVHFSDQPEHIFVG